MIPVGTTCPSRLFYAAILAILLVGWSGPARSDEGGFSLGTEFTYQGSLHYEGAPAEGVFDVTFELYDQREGGTFQGRVDRFDLPVRDGRLIARIDFGSDVRSQDAWVAIEVRAAGRGAYTRLEPRQRVAGGCTVDEDVTINGQLFVDSPSAAPDISIACCNDVDNGGGLLINDFLGALKFDGGEIQAEALGNPSQILINADGGNVGIGVASAAAPLNIPAGPDAEPDSGGSVVVGNPAGLNMALDNNEIMVRNDGATSTLFLNNDGGRVLVGGNLDIGLEIVQVNSDSNNYTVSCPAGKAILAGSCGGGSDSVNSSIPESSTTWRCVFDSSGPHEAYAICARVQW
ncbi:MAG: hypothetical protein K0U98_11630 [Deltaproteobacteria bacterium]|nr:hypothetical protein [Deltaproteobacteria bacterium]